MCHLSLFVLHLIWLLVMFPFISTAQMSLFLVYLFFFFL